MVVDFFGGVDEGQKRLLGNSVTDGGGAYDEGTVGDGLGDGGELFGRREYWSASDGGASLSEGGLVGLNDAQAKEAEVAHGAGGSPYVQGIARADENDPQTVLRKWT